MLHINFKSLDIRYTKKYLNQPQNNNHPNCLTFILHPFVCSLVFRIYDVEKGLILEWCTIGSYEEKKTL